MKKIDELMAKQKVFFAKGDLQVIAFRKELLKNLKTVVLKYSDSIAEALNKDLGKSPFEAYATETGLILEEISNHINHLSKWTRPKKVKSPMVHFISKSQIYPEPFGNVLIFGTWNYPFQINLVPLIGAISAGNCAIIKPSEFTPHSSALLAKLIEEVFPEEIVSVIQGGVEESQFLLSRKFDMIFFTGSTKVGRIILEGASKYLTPVCLELGGKSPCIVDETANVDLSARRIVWGKFVNAGQTCIAPDYVFAHRNVKDQLLIKMQEYIKVFFGQDPKFSPDYARIINLANLNRLASLLSAGKLITGGQVIPEERYLSPTIIDEINPSDPIMQEEIFGPILPIMTYSNFEEVKAYVNANPKPLALYYFTQNRDNKKRIIREISSGTVCINETVMQFGNSHLPFGGVGNSGFGKYHGKFSFDTFSHFKAVLQKSTLVDLPFRYPPYTKAKLRIIKLFLR
jgi:acyl-CoA reductase-like NAD-dependent aldehyde dehydrogenase